MSFKCLECLKVNEELQLLTLQENHDQQNNLQSVLITKNIMQYVILVTT